ncbi:MAG TPA: hypothetical protein VF939_02760 [Puia sp.]
MSQEQMQGLERTSPMSGEFTKALVEKMVGHGADLRDVSEQIRKLPNPTPTLEGLDRHVGEMVNRMDLLGENFAKIGNELGRISKGLALPVDSIGKLEDQLKQHALLFERPLKKSVHYTHFMGQSLLVGAILVIIIIGLTILWDRALIKADQHTDNDIKWRTAKLTSDSLVLNALNETERAYLANPDGMRKSTLDEEERRQELFEQWQRVNQAAGEIRRLEEKKKMK